jgi:hypothetical protein
MSPRQLTRKRLISALLCGAAIILALKGPAPAADTTAPQANKHLGVGSCDSNVCHGKLAAQTDRNVALNEARIWSRDDDHHKAFLVLSNAQSQRIAAKLGIGDPAGAKICLDCHADNVALALRGPKFQLREGVTCEACHGGSEQWIKTHTEKSEPHSANVAHGMYPTEQPLRRAELCLSCHMGTRDKFTTHMILGAGHPRLQFELQWFTAAQPPHFIVDADYVQRKGRIEPMNLWVSGQIEDARRYLELLQTRVSRPDSFLPDFALYECFACHHPIDKPRWSRARAGPGIDPGTLRLQKYPFVMLEAITEVLSPADLPELTAASDSLMRAGQKDLAQMRAEAQKLHAWIDARDSWIHRQYVPAEILKMRRTVLRYAADDKASDFSTADQIYLSMDSLSFACGDHERRKAPLDSLFTAVQSTSAFDPAQFASVARSLESQF